MNKFQLSGKIAKALLVALFVVGLVGNTGGPAVQADVPAQAGMGTTLYMPSVYQFPKPEWLGPDGGSIVCLKAAPSDPNVVYAGTLSTGVYRSSNRGVTWTRASSGLGMMFIDSVEVDPTNANIVYAGTHGTGVYKSVNGGASWFPVNTGIAADSVVYTVAVNPGNTNLVYAGTRIENTTYHGVTYKSTNGGASWSKVMDFSDDWVYSIAVNPSDPNIVLAAVHTGGPVYSTNYGSKSSWIDATPPTFSDTTLAVRWLKGRAVAFDPRGWLNRAFYTSWHDGMVSYSSTNGTTWRMSSGDLGNSHIYPNGISVKPGSPDVVYMATHSSNIAGVLRSDDAGRTWSGAGLYDKTVYSVAALSGGGDSLLAGTYMDGLYKSDNGGASWYYSMSGITESNVTGMVFTGGNTVYGSTKTGGGVFRSLDGGKTWTLFNNNLGDININGLVQHPAQPNTLFALTNKAGLRRIDLNSSGSWSSAEIAPLTDAEPVEETDGLFAPPAPPDDALAIDGEKPLLPKPDAPQLNAELMAVSAPVLSMIFAPSNSSVAYLGTNGSGVYRSGDSGLNWASTGLTSGAVRSVAVHPSNPDMVYAATNQAGVIKVSSNSGGSWQVVSLPNTSLAVYAVDTLPGDPNAVFVGTSNGVYRYANGNWAEAGLTGYNVRVLAHNPATPNLLFAGTTAGAFRSSADKSLWISLAEELSSESISSLNFNPADTNYVYVGTGVRGTLKIFLP